MSLIHKSNANSGKYQVFVQLCKGLPSLLGLLDSPAKTIKTLSLVPPKRRGQSRVRSNGCSTLSDLVTSHPLLNELKDGLIKLLV